MPLFSFHLVLFPYPKSSAVKCTFYVFDFICVQLQLDLSPCGKLLVNIRHFGGSSDPPALPELAETANPVGESRMMVRLSVVE